MCVFVRPRSVQRVFVYRKRASSLSNVSLFLLCRDARKCRPDGIELPLNGCSQLCCSRLFYVVLRSTRNFLSPQQTAADSTCSSSRSLKEHSLTSPRKSTSVDQNTKPHSLIFCFLRSFIEYNKCCTIRIIFIIIC